MTIYYDFDEVDSFTITTIGKPGDRTFFLQVRRGETHITVKCEKQQTAAMAMHIRRVLDDLPPGLPREPLPLTSEMEPIGPLDAAFVLGPIGLGYDRDQDRVMIHLEEFALEDVGDDEVDDDEVDVDDEDDRISEPTSTVRVLLTRAQAVAFCSRTEQIVSAGRPPCRWCGLPLDAEGHACPRMN